MEYKIYNDSIKYVGFFFWGGGGILRIVGEYLKSVYVE